jgi:hypothetical protein
MGHQELDAQSVNLRHLTTTDPSSRVVEGVPSPSLPP